MGVLGEVKVVPLFGLGLIVITVGAKEVVPPVWFDTVVKVVVLLPGLNVVELAGETVVALIDVFGVVDWIGVVRFATV